MVTFSGEAPDMDWAQRMVEMSRDGACGLSAFRLDEGQPLCTRPAVYFWRADHPNPNHVCVDLCEVHARLWREGAQRRGEQYTIRRLDGA